jgi:single-strand DNA-binding protein
MASFNKVILAGNLTRDPEVRYTPKGLAIAKLGIAVNRTWKNEAGETKEEVTFVDVDSFGRQAEVIAQYFRKGKPILIEGRLRLDQWDDKQTGQKRSKLGVVLEGFSFLDSNRTEGADAPAGGGGSSGSGRPRPTSAPASTGPAGNAPDAEGPPEEDEVPF